ncbi:MAG: tricarballylate utilization 4Fe-4S protein TcuB [Candidatus Korobacteraceae bacterium]|jgi:citrate/tricarballylate utilization protein
MQQSELMREGEHMMTVCNACRYCEGFCAVWPAMEFRRKFAEGDLTYLANLCHNCSECYYACQYAPPHEWEVNPPQTFAKIRAQSYEQYAWPKPLASAFRANALVVSLAVALMLVIFLFGATQALGGKSLATAIPRGDFYKITSHETLVLAFGAAGLFATLALLIGLVRFWRGTGEQVSDLTNLPALATAIKDVLALKYLDDSGWGCAYPSEKSSQSRRWFHHFTFYGFLLCFAATTLGAIYYYGFGWKGPYGYFSLPVVLGTLGGIGLLIGPSGLYFLKLGRNREITDEKQCGMDVAFLVMLLLTSASGLLLLVLRETAAMSSLLVIHLGVVMALFLTLPYGKFVHGVYRCAALLKYALERARKQTLGV